MGSESLRTLVVAYNEISSEVSLYKLDSDELDKDYIESGLIFLAIAGIEDPVRQGVPESVDKARGAGISTRKFHKYRSRSYP